MTSSIRTRLAAVVLAVPLLAGCAVLDSLGSLVQNESAMVAADLAGAIVECIADQREAAPDISDQQVAANCYLLTANAVSDAITFYATGELPPVQDIE